MTAGTFLLLTIRNIEITKILEHASLLASGAYLLTPAAGRKSLTPRPGARGHTGGLLTFDRPNFHARQTNLITPSGSTSDRYVSLHGEGHILIGVETILRYVSQTQMLLPTAASASLSLLILTSVE